MGQLILSVLIGEELPTNFITLAKTAQANGLSAYAALTAAVNKRKTTKPPRFPLTTYEGSYWNAAENLCLTITANGASLTMKVQDSPENTYHLEPWGGDTFCWPPDREKELCEQSMWFNLRAASHEIVFGAARDGGGIERLMWHHDAAGKPETFRKRRGERGSL